MLEAARVINLIDCTSSYNDKRYLLKKNAAVPGLKDILKFIYNPYHKTGISLAKLYKALEIADSRGAYNMGSEPFISYEDIIQYLTKHQTGSDADLAMAARFINCTKTIYCNDSATMRLAYAIITQDLQIGVSDKTLNVVFGNSFIPTVGCMLGTKITALAPSKVKWPCIVTEKLDGIRRILIKEKGQCRLFSRSGHEDEGLVDILEEAKYLPDNRVYDGELIAIGDFTNNIELRQASMSRSSIKGAKHGLSYNIFDMLPVEEFYNGISEDTALVRKLLLGATLMDESIQFIDGIEQPWPMLIASYGIHRKLEFIKAVPILGYANNMADVTPIVEAIWARGGEGVMLNTISGFYEIKRSKDLLKVKLVQEITLPVVNMFEGAGKFEDMLGGLVVDYKSYKVGVGSGFTEAQRIHIWNNPERYIGRRIEIDHFGESTNSQGGISLNCPIFKRFVGDQE